MYCRMLEVSRRLESTRRTGANLHTLPRAEDHLYRGQCNCPYWHGAFGGIYLPHLRNATYRELISADNLLENTNGGNPTWIDVATEDFNKDLYTEVRLANDQLVAYLAPSQGGMLYELDVRSISHNLLATLQRRPESYHQKVLTGGSQNNQEAASIHDRVVFKQSGLEKKLQYDKLPRKSMLDHFLDNDVSLTAISRGEAENRGDFASSSYDARIRRGANKIQVQCGAKATHEPPHHHHEIVDDGSWQRCFDDRVFAGRSATGVDLFILRSNGISRECLPVLMIDSFTVGMQIG